MINNNQAEFVLMLKIDEEEKKSKITESDLVKIAPIGVKPCCSCSTSVMLL